MELIPVAAQPLSPSTDQSTRNTLRCEYCDGTGDVHSIDGEWRGVCHCPAGDKFRAAPSKPAPTLEQAYAEGRKDERESLSDPIAAKVVYRVKKECDALGLDVVGFAWRLQKEWFRTSGQSAQALIATAESLHHYETADRLRTDVESYPLRAALAQQSDFRGLETGEGPQGDAATEQSSGASTS